MVRAYSRVVLCGLPRAPCKADGVADRHESVVCGLDPPLAEERRALHELLPTVGRSATCPCSTPELPISGVEYSENKDGVSVLSQGSHSAVKGEESLERRGARVRHGDIGGARTCRSVVEGNTFCLSSPPFARELECCLVCSLGSTALSHLHGGRSTPSLRVPAHSK